jgi:GNAT superfamily N-acetyltransferase
VGHELQASAHDNPLSICLAVADLAPSPEIGGERTDDELADLPRVTAIRLRSTHEMRLRSDLPADLRTELMALAAADVYANRASVITVLARDEPCDNVIVRIAYAFPDALDPYGFPDVVRIKPDDMTLLLQFDPEFELGEKVVFAAVTDGRVAAACTSAHDETLLGDEAYLYTQPGYRGRGFGRQVALAWAYYMQRRGAIPFFAYDPEGPEGKACAALAHSLRVVPLCEVVVYY